MFPTLGPIHKWFHPRGGGRGCKKGDLGWSLRHGWGDKGRGVKKLENQGDIIYASLSNIWNRKMYENFDNLNKHMIFTP